MLKGEKSKKLGGLGIRNLEGGRTKGTPPIFLV